MRIAIRVLEKSHWFFEVTHYLFNMFGFDDLPCHLQKVHRSIAALFVYVLDNLIRRPRKRMNGNRIAIREPQANGAV